MNLIFEDENRRYEVKNLNDIDEIYSAIKDGLIAMNYHKNTAKQFIEEMKKE